MKTAAAPPATATTAPVPVLEAMAMRHARNVATQVLPVLQDTSAQLDALSQTTDDLDQKVTKILRDTSVTHTFNPLLSVSPQNDVLRGVQSLFVDAYQSVERAQILAKRFPSTESALDHQLPTLPWVQLDVRNAVRAVTEAQQALR